MKKFLYYSFLIAVFGNSLNGQNVNFNNNAVYITFSANKDQAYLDYNDKILISNSQNVIIAGEIYSDSSIAIIPYQTYSIVIKPPGFSVSGLPSNPQNPAGDPPGTVIKPKPGGPQRIYSPVVVLYPVPVHTTLNFDITNFTVIGYEIYDTSGLVKLTESFSPRNTYAINVSTLTNANYFLKLNLGNNQFSTIQFIKN
jgi:Secretion system C-terminal sorting domain